MYLCRDFCKISNYLILKRIPIKEINRLAFPALVSGIIEPIISLTDTIMAGHIKENTKDILGAVGIVSSFITALVWIFIQGSKAISAQISYAYGQNRLQQMRGLVAQVLSLSLVISVGCALITYLFTDFVLKDLYKAEKGLLENGLIYFRIRVWGLPLTFLTLAIHNIFRGLQNTSWAMYTGILSGITNLVLDYLFVFVFDWNIRGLAWASLLAQAIMLATSVYLLYTKTPFRFQRTRRWHPDFMQNTRMSLDLFLRSLMMQATLYFSYYAATRLGGGKESTIVATHTVLNQVWLFSVFLFDGFCSAGGVLSGRLYSSEQFASIRYMIRDLFFIVTGIGLGIALVYFTLYIQIGEWLTKDADIRRLFYETFWIVVLMQPINAVAFLFDGFYKGLGFTKTLRNAFLIATFLGFFPIYYFVEYAYHWGLMGIWIALLIWMVFRGGILIIHYKTFFVTYKSSFFRIR